LLLWSFEGYLCLTLSFLYFLCRNKDGNNLPDFTIKPLPQIIESPPFKSTKAHIPLSFVRPDHYFSKFATTPKAAVVLAAAVLQYV